jgi:hypothetical protein
LCTLDKSLHQPSFEQCEIPNKISHFVIAVTVGTEIASKASHAEKLPGLKREMEKIVTRL